MQITTAISTRIDLEEACHEAASQALAGLNGASVDLCLLFVSGSYGSKVVAAPQRITELVDPTRLVGCAAGGIIGAGIVGPHAGDLISECALAIEMGSEAGDIGLTIHPHPTLSETVAMAAEVFEGTVTDLYIPKKRK